MEGQNERMFGILENLRKEQEELSKALKEKEREAKDWEERKEKGEEVLEGLEAEFTRVRREEWLVERDLDTGERKVLKLKATVMEKTAQYEAHTRNVEKLKMLKKVIEDRNQAMASQCKEYKEKELEAEKDTLLGRELEAVRRTREFVEKELAGMVAEFGLEPEVQERAEAQRQEVVRLEEEGWQVEEEWQLLEQVNEERRCIVAKMEIEARMRENKMQAQVRRLRSRRDELLAARKGGE